MSYFFENIVYSFWPGEIPHNTILYYPRSINLFEAAHFRNLCDLRDKSCNNLILVLNRKEELVLIPSIQYKNLVIVLPRDYPDEIKYRGEINQLGYNKKINDTHTVKGFYGLKFWEPYVSGFYESVGNFIQETYSIIFCKDQYEFVIL